MDWIERLNEAFKETGWSVAELSRRSGVPTDSLHKYLDRKVKQPRGNTLDNLARALGVDAIWLKEGIRSDTATTVVPVMGYVGAGAEVEPEFEQVPHDGLDQVEIPLSMPDDLIAFEIRGESMLPMYRPGMVIVAYRDRARQLEMLYGVDAVVKLADGRRLVKTILRGPEPGKVNLFSLNSRLIENVELEWVGEIVAILPPRIVRHLGRRREVA